MDGFLPKYQFSYEDWRTQLKPTDCDCKSCHWMDTAGDRILLLNASGPEHEFNRVYKQVLDKWKGACPRWLSQPKARSHKGNGAKAGIWAGTLTMAPTDPENEETMIAAIKKIMSQKTSPVEKYSWYLEYTADGLPHIHFIYQRPHGARILSKVFKRYWKTWDENSKLGRGHRGGYHSLCSTVDGYLEYIQKDQGRHESNWPL